MKKLIFILFAFLAISTNAQTIPVHPTIKLTKLTAGGSNDDILTIGTDKVVKKVAKSSLVPDISGKENTIAPGTSSQYFRGDKTWVEFPSVSVEPLEFDSYKRTVWNTGKGSIYLNTSFGRDAFRSNSTGQYDTAYGYFALGLNSQGNQNTGIGSYALSNNLTGSDNTAVGIEAGALVNIVSANGSPSKGVYIGKRASAGNWSENNTNEIVIGCEAIGAGSNTATLGNTDIVKTVLRGKINTASMPVYADNAAATTGGLAVGDQYRTSTGVLMVRY